MGNNNINENMPAVDGNNKYIGHKVLLFFKTHYLIIGLLLLSIFLRIQNIYKPEGLWFDEIVSYSSSQESFPFGIIKFCFSQDLQPPMYSLFLHLWTLIFGTDDTVLRLMSVVFGVATVPVIYHTASLIAEKRAGLIAATLAAINSLLILYSQEVRIYPLATFFAALSVMFFVKVLKNSEIKKNYILYAITNLFLIYTSSFGVVFVFFQSITYLAYLLIKKQPFKTYFFTQFITFLLSLPFVYIVFHYASSDSKNIVSTFDWAQFQPVVLYYLLQDWFSPVLVNIYNYPIGYLSNLFNSGLFFVLFAFILFPIIYITSGILNSLKKKETIILFLSFLGIISFQVLMTILGKIAIVSRYTIVCVPILLILAGVGLSNFKKPLISKTNKIILSLYLIASMFFIFISPESVLRYHRPETMRTPYQVLSKLHFTDNDYLLMPYGGKYSQKYNENKVKMVQFDILRLFYAGDKDLLLRIFDENFANSLTMQNSREKFQNYIFNHKPSSILEKYLNTNIFSKMKKGEKFAFAVSKGINLYSRDDFNFFSQNIEIYNKQSLFFMLSSKMSMDVCSITKKYLQISSVQEDGIWVVFVFEKP